MAAATHSRQHRQAFLIALRTATTPEAMERAMADHSKHMTPSDHAEARAALAVRLADLSPTTKEAT